MQISVAYLMVSMWIIIWIELAFIIFLYERIIKLKFFMGMNVWATKKVKELKDKVNWRY